MQIVPSRRNAMLLCVDGVTWQTGMAKGHRYGKRSVVETPRKRNKTIPAARLNLSRATAQRCEAAIAVAVLSRMMEATSPNSVNAAMNTA